MLHAAAMLIGLFVLGLLATQRWTSPEDLLLAVAIAGSCTVIAARLGGVAVNGFSRAPQMIMLSAARLGAVARGVLSVMRAAIAADVTVNPALVRIRTRPADGFSSSALAALISVTPGMVVVDADADGLLAHVIDEDAIDAADLGALEARVLGSLQGRRA